MDCDGSCFYLEFGVKDFRGPGSAFKGQVVGSGLAMMQTSIPAGRHIGVEAIK